MERSGAGAADAAGPAGQFGHRRVRRRGRDHGQVLRWEPAGHGATRSYGPRDRTRLTWPPGGRRIARLLSGSAARCAPVLGRERDGPTMHRPAGWALLLTLAVAWSAVPA